MNVTNLLPFFRFTHLGVILAGGLVYLTHSPYPDLLIGLAIFVVVARGALRIFQLAR